MRLSQFKIKRACRCCGNAESALWKVVRSIKQVAAKSLSHGRRGGDGLTSDRQYSEPVMMQRSKRFYLAAGTTSHLNPSRCKVITRLPEAVSTRGLEGLVRLAASVGP